MEPLKHLKVLEEPLQAQKNAIYSAKKHNAEGSWWIHSIIHYCNEFSVILKEIQID